MNLERWKQIEAIYHSALEVEAAERDDFLVIACAGDDGLRQEVVSLLSSAERTDSFMEESALSLGLAVLGAEHEPLTGKRVGRYTLLELLGRGGMGEVYLAYDPSLNRRIALKLLPADTNGDSERVRRFEQEARAASAISHPNVAHIYEIGVEQEQLYITMEFVRGQTLRHALKQGLMDVSQALDVVAQVASALSAAHEVGVIHRDIKPENVMLHDDGYVKVLDFGLAKLVENRSYASDPDARPLPSLHTGPELLMGTSDYMSPEQIRRQPVDKRTDLWSLGIVLYELLAGRRPFVGRGPSEVIVSVLEREPEPLGNVRPGLPPALEEFVAKALMKPREERHQSAQSMVVELRRLRRLVEERETAPRPRVYDKDGSSPPPPELPRPSSQLTQPPRAVMTNELSRPQRPLERRAGFNPAAFASTHVSHFKRNWSPFYWLILLSIVSVGLYIGLARLRPSALLHREINLRFERLNLSGGISDIILSPDGKYVASVVMEEGKHTIHITEIATTSDLRIAPPSQEGYSGLSFSPDGTYVYYIENQTQTGTLYRVSKLGGGQRKILDNVNTAVTFSPDGSRMAFTRVNNPVDPADLIIAQADGSSERVLVRRTRADSDFFFSDMRGAGTAWSPDGKLLACPTRNMSRGNITSSIEVLDAETGVGKRLNAIPWHGISRVAWLADGSGLIVAAKESATAPWQLVMLSYPGGEIRQVTKDPNNYTRISGTADSRAFLTLNVEEDSNIWLVSLEEEERFSPRTVVKKKGVSEVVWKPDGKLVYVIYDGINSNLWTQDANGEGAARQLTFEANVNFRPVVTPDQRYIVFVSTRAGDHTNIWRMDADGTHLKQLTSGSYEDMPSVTPDSQWVIYRTGSDVRKVSIDGGSASKLFDKGALNPVVSPDGRLLALFTNDRLDSKKWHLEVLDLSTRATVKRFDLPEATNPFFSLRWTPGGDGLTYISNADGTSNLWLQQVNGAAPRRLTDFRDAEIQSFSWSADGKQVACVRRAKTYIPILVRLF